MCAFATALFNMGKYDEAILYLQKALELDLFFFGENSTSVANVYSNMSYVLSKKEFNYQEVLSKADDEKVKREIELDVLRTTIGNVENPNQIRAYLSRSSKR